MTSIFRALGSAMSRWRDRQGYALAHRLGPMAGRVPLPQILAASVEPPWEIDLLALRGIVDTERTHEDADPKVTRMVPR